MTLRRLPEPSKAKKPPTPVPAPCPGNSCIEMSYCNLRRLKELLGTGDEKAVPKDPGDGSHVSGASSWIPPAENWDAALPGLPYGWECAVDKEGKPYYINHLNKTTTYEDPRVEFAEEPPSPREVSLERQPDIGFGFVAGSEKPVIVRFVTENGPSDGKLLPGDQIWSVNSEDVKTAPRDHVIQLVRSCRDKVKLVVCQPPVDNSGRKSAILSAAKKARLRNRPPKVRFAEGVVINGAPLYSPSGAFSESEDLSVPFMPNVLKVFLENGQTKSFKYDSSTTVGDVLESLQAKLSIKAMENFALVVEHIKSLRRNKLTILDPQESLARIAARPGAQHLRCCFRVTYVPKDAYELLRNDSVAFEYLYTQSRAGDLGFDRQIQALIVLLFLEEEFWHDVVSIFCVLSTFSSLAVPQSREAFGRSPSVFLMPALTLFPRFVCEYMGFPLNSSCVPCNREGICLPLSPSVLPVGRPVGGDLVSWNACPPPAPPEEIHRKERSNMQTYLRSTT
ncbi:unnamed protein product [Cyprideis torosa]|uniref:Uncharacterized protein n=1 Tax=Cyprideis torosa TaxID=163714 RepID=A0A7R8ZP30_9CRUS|nr:unnamed protein product [Cyprideis torosa]CAG0887650.1 unnamed protein product [Cyprideis torosa]